uniref:Actin related protein 2/3 complex, subunit 1A n=1 Tax=Neolamprologus brichardi TaxID=32507 RepID=A0A3Q4MJM8_NEOBR
MLVLKTEFLPLLSVIFISENSLVAAGHDCCPMLFRCDDGGALTFVTKLDLPKQSIQRNISAMERFRNMDKRATTEDRNTALDTLHQNSITQVSIYEGDKRDCRKFCTTGIDGAMTIWDFKVKIRCGLTSPPFPPLPSPLLPLFRLTPALPPLPRRSQ